MKSFIFFKKGFKKSFQNAHFFIQLNQRDKKLKRIESGRSMVEMLGVLAVVGVLSVGGILGYKYGMTKYQTNQITNELNLTSSQIAMALLRPHSGDFELVLGDPYDAGFLSTNNLAFDFGCGTNPGGEDNICVIDDSEYYEQIFDVSEDVCRQLVQLSQNLAYLNAIQVNGTDDITGASCGENNTLTYLFSIDGEDTDLPDNPEDMMCKENEVYNSTEAACEIEKDNRACYYSPDFRGALTASDLRMSADGTFATVTCKVDAVFEGHSFASLIGDINVNWGGAPALTREEFLEAGLWPQVQALCGQALQDTFLMNGGATISKGDGDDRQFGIGELARESYASGTDYLEEPFASHYMCQYN